MGGSYVSKGLLAVALLIVVVMAVMAYNWKRTTISAAILPPATIPSKDAICSQPLHHSIDGSFSPLFCPGGEINRDAWTYIAADGPEVMELGPNANPQGVMSAIQQDLQNSESGSRECNAALLAAAYYGWDFRLEPIAGLPLDCPILR